MAIAFPLLQRTPRLADSLALFFGMLTPLAFAPIGYFPVAVISLAGLFALWEGVSLRRIFWRGWLFGVGMFGVGVSWVYISIHVYGKAAVPVAVLATALMVAVLALFPAIAGYAGRRWGFHNTGWRIGLGLPCTWILLEWLRGWVFTGFPFLQIGYSQINSWLAGFAPLAGVYGVGLMVALSAGGLVLCMCYQGWQRIGVIAALAMLWLGGGVLAEHPWTESRGEALQVSIIQGNIAQDQKWLPEQQRATLERYVDLTADQWGRDLIVWPETAIPLFYDEVEAGFVQQLQDMSQQTNTDLITGIPLLDQEHWEVYNTVMSVGDSRGFYRKQHLVPFGEYLPLRKWLGDLLEFFTVPLGDFARGAKDQPLLEAAGYPIGTSICYEVAFGNEIIRSLPEAAWLINVSNDGWFGDSLAPHQHLDIARMRAAETGRYLLRATNTGISALIDPRGRLLAVAPQFQAAVVQGSIEPLSGSTPYVRFGNWLIITILFVIVVVGSASRRTGYR